jgi:hypothetical protein
MRQDEVGQEQRAAPNLRAILNFTPGPQG